MKKHLGSMFLAACLGFQPWASAQGSQPELFDVKKVNKEMEVMRGILRTTLGFVAKELQGGETGPDRDRGFREAWSFSSISSFYLYGQGAVFTIPASTLFNAFSNQPDAMEALLDAQQEQMEAAQELVQQQAELLKVQLEREVLEGVLGGVSGGAPGGVGGGVGTGTSTPPAAPAAATPPSPGAPPAPPAPFAAPTPQAAPAPDVKAKAKTVAKAVAGEERVRQRLAALQDRVRRQKEINEQKRAKFREMLAQMRVYLIETLANHGDSLTQVRPNEYITLIINEDSRSVSQTQILSVQKSFITDYKAGRLTLEAFRSKVLDYTN